MDRGIPLSSQWLVGAAVTTFKVATKAEEALNTATAKGAKVAAAGVEVAKSHPRASTAVATGALTCACPALLAAPLLSAAGFGSSGVVGGSAAAGSMSSAGNVAAGSAIAVLLSAGAGGAGLAVVNGIAGTVGGVVTAVGVAGAALGRKGKEGVKEDMGVKTGDGGQEEEEEEQDRGEYLDETSIREQPPPPYTEY